MSGWADPAEANDSGAARRSLLPRLRTTSSVAYVERQNAQLPTASDADLSSPENSPRYTVPSRDNAGGSPLYRGLRLHSNTGLYETMRSASPSLANSPSMMRHVRVEAEEVPATAGQQGPEEVILENVPLEPNAMRREELDSHISWQINDLYKFFSQLYDKDQGEIADLEDQLKAKEQQLQQLRLLSQSRKRSDDGEVVITTKRGSSKAAMYMPYEPEPERGILASMMRRPGTWCLGALLAIALLVITILCAVYVPRPSNLPPAPGFSTAPALLSTTTTSMDVEMQVDRTALLQYLLLPASSVRGDIHAQTVQDAIIGMAALDVQAAAAACGTLPMNDPSQLYMLSIMASSSLECQQAWAASGASCSRCPRLTAGTEYNLYMVAKNGGGSSSVQMVSAWTMAPGAETTPVLKSGTAVKAASEYSFDLSFSLDRTGSLTYVVAYQSMFARFDNNYVVFDTSVPDISHLLKADLSTFTDGIVARGTIKVADASQAYTCRVGGSNAGLNCSCGSGPCNTEALCFGSLCKYSKYALAANTTYRVLLVPSSADGTSQGTPQQVGPVTTLPQQQPPKLSRSTSVSDSIGPTSFKLQALQQDKVGFSYILLTKPASGPMGVQVQAGTSTDWQMVSSNRRRRLLTLSAGTLPLLPASEAVGVGSTFLPPCFEATSCNMTSIAAQYINNATETLVDSRCVPVASLNDRVSTMFSSLKNNTLYKVTVVLTDASNNQIQYAAFVRTVDLTAPVFTGTDKQTGFTNFSVSASVDKPGTVYATVVPARSANATTRTVSCPPSFTSDVVTQKEFETSGDRNLSAVFSFTTGVRSATGYVVYLLAKDSKGNCQPEFTTLYVHTDDDMPPVTQQLQMGEVRGNSGDLQITIDEPSTVYYMLMVNGSAQCPGAQDVFDQRLPSGAQLPPANATGTILVPDYNPADFTLAPLADGVTYVVCTVARDNTNYRNNQTAVSSLVFSTPDVTPPGLILSLAPSSDGAVSCSRSSFKCNATVSATLSEPGVVAYVVLANSTLPANASNSTAQQLLSTPAGDLFPGAKLWGGNISVTAAGAAGSALALDLDSQAPFTMLAAAVDAAGNINSTVAMQAFTTPDVNPPTFNSRALSAAQEDNLTLAVDMSEPCSIKYTVVAAGTAAPTAAQVLAATGPGNGTLAVGNASIPTAAVLTSIAIANLTKGTLVDVYLVATDAAGNQQAAVANISSIRTIDNTPPVVSDLSVSYKLPMTLTISAKVDKPGKLFYMARRLPAAEPGAVGDVVAGAGANFSGSAVVSQAGQALSISLCVADGDQMKVWVVAQDQEGNYAGRLPNNSTMEAANVTLQPAASQFIGCKPQLFLGKVQPYLSLAPGSPGYALGAASSSSNVSGQVWAQSMAGFMSQSDNSTAQLQVQAGTLLLPGAVALQVKGQPPASVAVIARNPGLIAEDNAVEGRTLSLAYQLRDAAQRSWVNNEGLTIRPVLTYTSGAPSGINAAAAQTLPDCSIAALSSTTGIGDCSILVDTKLFPASGSPAAAGKVVVKVMAGDTVLTSSAGLQVTLSPATSHPAFVPPAQGLLVTLPYRNVAPGEKFKVTVTAGVSGAQGINAFNIPIRYSSVALQYLYTNASSLWVPPSESLQALPGAGVLQLAGSARASGQPDNLYRGSSVPLVEVYFQVQQGQSGTLQAVSLASGAALMPAASQPLVSQFNDYRAGAQPDGWLTVVPPQPRGLLAYLSDHDIFNTAVFSAAPVLSTVSAVLVNSWGDGSSRSPLSTVVTPDSCAVEASAAAALAAAAPAPPGQPGWGVAARSSHTAGVKGAKVTVVYQSFTTEVFLSAFYPSNVELQLDDATLNKVLPINTAAPPPGCSDLYQATRARAYADWGNGGNSSSDSVKAVDISRHVILQSSDGSAALVMGNMIKGLSAKSGVTISIQAANSAVGASATLAVSNDPVCLASLDAQATTGVRFLSAPKPVAGSSINGSWEARQDLTWEDSSAYVLTYATFSDGAIMDVSTQVAVTSQKPLQTDPMPFSLRNDSITGLPMVAVNASVGDTQACSQYLSATWTVCSAITLGSGTGTVIVSLPAQQAVSSFTAQPETIVSSLNAASQQPISLPTTSALSVSVLFTDGSVRDFTTDSRTSYTVTRSADLCTVTRDEAGKPVVKVQDAAAGLFGSCSIEATVAFPNGTVSKTVVVNVMSMQALNVYMLSYNTFALPSTSSNQLPLPAPATMRLLKCDWRNYDQRSVWLLAALSNCTGASSCDQVPISNAAYANLTVSDSSVAALAANPGYPFLANRLMPARPGTTTLTATFGSSSRSIGLQVEDTFQDSWPRVAGINDTSFTITANMSSSSNWTVTAWVQPSSQLDLAANPPTAADVEKNGLALQPDGASGPTFYADLASQLKPATVYTALLAVRSSAFLAPSVTAVTGIMTPDTQAPSLTSVALLNSSADSTHFFLTLELGMDEPGFISYALYRDVPCVTAEPSLLDVRQRADLGAAACSCSPSLCTAAAAGNLTLLNRTSDTFTVKGTLPPSPYEFLRNAQVSQLTCQPAPSITYASTAHKLYLVAEDDLPTYKGWTITCNPPAVNQSTPPTTCAPVATAPCTTTPPTVETNNVQAGAYAPLDLSNPLPKTGSPRQPASAAITIADPSKLSFDDSATNVSSASSTITFSFKVTKPGLVRYQLLQLNTPVFNGVFPVFDPAGSYSVSISRACDGSTLTAPAYSFYYDATDNYGKATQQRSVSVNFN